MNIIFFLFACIPVLLFSMTKGEFISWWNTFRQQSQIPVHLREMEDYFVNSTLIDYSSKYWNFLNKQNIEQLTVFGYQNFKQTVARNYFTWVVSNEHNYAKNLKAIPLHTRLPKDQLIKQHALFSKPDSLNYNRILELHLNHIITIGAQSYLNLIEEPLIGNPPFLTWNNHRISQDIFNSLLEFLSVSKHLSPNHIQTIIEVGAGSGRTAYCFLSLLPEMTKYIIVDFPPALYISQSYLSEVFPNKIVFHFRPFQHFDEIATEYFKADIVFLTPDQMHQIPSKSADIFLAIDCLHEMNPYWIVNYFNEANRLANYMYFKCWQKTIVPYDGHLYTNENYPVPKHWQMIFNEPCFVPSDFFHAFYKI